MLDTAAYVSIIVLLITIAFYAGRSHGKLTILMTQVKEFMEHTKECDTDRAVKGEQLETVQAIVKGQGKRITTLEGF